MTPWPHGKYQALVRTIHIIYSAYIIYTTMYMAICMVIVLLQVSYIHRVYIHIYAYGSGSPANLQCVSTQHSAQRKLSEMVPNKKYNFSFMQASRSQDPPEPGFSPGSPESALQILALPFGQTQNLLKFYGARTG